MIQCRTLSISWIFLYLFFCIPVFSAEQVLNQEFTIEEIDQVLTHTKSSELDGLSVEFYRAFKVDMLPYLQEIFSYCLSKKFVPSSWTEARIALIPKSGKNIRYPETYRTISILNIYYKILASLLASRLSRIIGVYVHLDQTGYIPGKYLKDNIMKVSKIINVAQKRKTPVAVFLNAKKVFDRLEWKFSHLILKRFGTGEIFQKLIKLLYKEQCAFISIEGQIQRRFQFIQQLDRVVPYPRCFLHFHQNHYLQLAIHGNKRIQGFTTSGKEHIIALYVDDIVWFFENPLSSILVFFLVISEFGQISGYKVNGGKSILVSI